MRHADEGSLEGLGGCEWWTAVLNSELRVCLIEIRVFHQGLKGREGKNCAGRYLGEEH